MGAVRSRVKFFLAGALLLSSAAQAASLAELIRDGDREAVAQALAAGTEVNLAAADGSTPLLWAVHAVDLPLVQQLLARGADPDARNVLGMTPLVEAVGLGHAGMVRLLLKAGATPDLGNDDAQTPLMLAARLGALPIVQMLVEAGANVNARERYREQTPLMWAVAASKVDVAAYLMKKGAQVDVRAAINDWGNQITSEPRAQYRAAGGHTPLLVAARAGCTGCARLLLEAGAAIDRPTPEGVTPLMLAIDNANFDTADYLLTAGANPHLSDWYGRTALYVAVDMNSRSTAMLRPGFGSVTPDGVEFADATVAREPVRALQVAQRLLEMGVDPDVQLNMHRPGRGGSTARFTDDLLTTGCTPLLRAASVMDREAVALLLRHGAAVDLPNVMGVTPLMAASGIGYGHGSSRAGVPAMGPDPEANAVAVIELLLQAGADVNARLTDTSSRTAVIARPSAMSDREGQTAIFGTISRGWARVAKLLLENGARVDIQDARGRTLRDAIEAKAGGRDDPASPQVRAVLMGAIGD